MSISKKTRTNNNSFLKTDSIRKDLAQAGKMASFIKTYSQNIISEKNKNTDLFWDTKFEKPEKLSEQDAMTKEKIKILVEFLPKRRSKILDLGIGQGYLEQKLKELKIEHDIYGVDISSTAIKRSKKKFIGNFLIGDILDIDRLYPPGSFDVIIAIEVLEHIYPQDIFNLYRKIYKLLRKDGIFIISTPINEGLLYKKANPSNHVRDYSEPVLKAEFKIANFRIISLKSLFAFQNYYHFKKILAIILPNRWKPNNLQIKAVKM